VRSRLDAVDLRPLASGGDAVLRYRLIDASTADAERCPPGATFRCVVVTNADGSSARGLWRPHDVHFSRDGDVGYVAAINSTFIVDVSRVLAGKVRTISVIPNLHEFPQTLSNPKNIQISHQADVTPDGKILVVTDERGGGSRTRAATRIRRA
jgi:hypothetical protein